MDRERKRTAEICLLVLVWVDITDETLTDAVAALTTKPQSIAEVVSSEIVSNLESLSYVEHAIASQL